MNNTQERVSTDSLESIAESSLLLIQVSSEEEIIINTQPTKPCKWCGEEDPKHFPFQCFQNPRRKKYKIPKMGKVAFAAQETRRAWFAANDPDSNGFYWCYLNISNKCPNKLTPAQTVLDHVKPKGSHPDLRNDLTNLMPACFWCNSLKGSRSLGEALKLKQRPGHQS